MKKTATTMFAIVGLASAANAAIVQWDAASQAIASQVTTSSATVVGDGTSTFAYDYGTLNAAGGQSIEFIFNTTADGTVSILGGVNDSAGGSQTSLRLEQWNNDGTFGASRTGVDANFTSASTFGADTHVVFTQNGGTLSLFVNGVLDATALAGWNELTGGVGTLWSTTGGGDKTVGTMLGVASYDTALTAGEVATLNAAFVAVPEPSSTALLGLGGLALILRRRK